LLEAGFVARAPAAYEVGVEEGGDVAVGVGVEEDAVADIHIAWRPGLTLVGEGTIDHMSIKSQSQWPERSALLGLNVVLKVALAICSFPARYLVVCILKHCVVDAR
jgi:hypothetical protein